MVTLGVKASGHALAMIRGAAPGTRWRGGRALQEWEAGE